MTTPPSDDLVKRFHGEEWSALPDRVRVHIRAIEAENIRLRADLTAMEDCKNTYATLAYEREQEVFKLRAELAEARAQRDASDAVIATDGVGVWRNEAIARHRAAQGGK